MTDNPASFARALSNLFSVLLHLAADNNELFDAFREEIYYKFRSGKILVIR